MSNYRRSFVRGGSYFLTIVTRDRIPLFRSASNVALLRDAIKLIRREMPFSIDAAVILPDHMHFVWTLPQGDDSYPKRVGRIKVEFTKAWRSKGEMQVCDKNHSVSRQRHRESNLWQRRYWEHTIQSETSYESILDYIHYNPVKHGLVSCPHYWEASSFHMWVRNTVYANQWACQCNNRIPEQLDFKAIESFVGDIEAIIVGNAHHARV